MRCVTAYGKSKLMVGFSRLVGNFLASPPLPTLHILAVEPASGDVDELEKEIATARSAPGGGTRSGGGAMATRGRQGIKTQHKRKGKEKGGEEAGTKTKAGVAEEEEEDLTPNPEVPQISDSDFFARNPEFSTWLLQAKRLFFSSLSSEQTHSLFSLFVCTWNAGKLPPNYYDGSITAAAAPRTNHDWGLGGRAGGAGGAGGAGAGGVGGAGGLGGAQGGGTGAWGAGGTSGGRAGRGGLEAGGEGDEEESRAERKARERMERKRERERQAMRLEEVVPRETGREAVIAERMARRRESAREREQSPEMGMKEKDVMGGGDDFQAR
ncbi:unnamed protein product [Closterium sp. Yama58-4]|nr:unnamed protein product [Closterium sp. Yama58-4]